MIRNILFVFFLSLIFTGYSQKNKDLNLSKRQSFYYDPINKLKIESQGYYYVDELGATTDRHGKWTFYNENGELVEERHYNRNKLNGEVKTFYGEKQPKDMLEDVVGPLGNPTEVYKTGTVLCAGGGVGIAPLLPVVRAFKEAGNRVITILAARSKEFLMLEDEIRIFSDEVIIMTDDGSYGRQGLVTHGMEEILEREKVHLAITIGPAIMMKYAALTTAKYNVKTIASLNTIMVDGTGMCGACRVTVGGKTKFVCVDGPEFDAHLVDYDELIMRLGAYDKQEREAYERYVGAVNAVNAG